MLAYRIARTVLQHEQVSRPHELSIVLADDEFVQKLNMEYRGKDAPTNVLSFPQYDEEEDFAPVIMLGDVVMAWQTVELEARLQGKSLAHHFAHLLTHGVLHLMGYDHENEEEAEEMEAIEVTILSRLGVANPYRELYDEA